MNPLLLTAVAVVGYAIIAAAVTGIRGATTPPRLDVSGRVQDQYLVVTGAFWPISIAIWVWNRVAKFFYWLSIWAKEARYTVTGEKHETTEQPEVQYADTGYDPAFHKEDYEPEVHAGPANL